MDAAKTAKAITALLRYKKCEANDTICYIATQETHLSKNIP
jgi:hypothetical protein